MVTIDWVAVLFLRKGYERTNFANSDETDLFFLVLVNRTCALKAKKRHVLALNYKKVRKFLN